jgi:CPA2 family monovalent cation:H+ antiporter-2
LVLVNDTAALATAVLIVIVGNGALAYGLTRIIGYSVETALVMAVGLAQIGEFSFILADLGIHLDLLPTRGRDLILGTSILTILANPFLVALATRIHPAHPPGEPVEPDTPPELHPTALSHHVVLVGYGRVGSLIGRALKERHESFLVVEDADRLVAALHESKVEVIPGNAVEPRVLQAANVREARLLLIAIPNGFEAGQIVQQSRALNPQLRIVARAHSNDEVDYLMRLSADAVIMGEREIARGMIEDAFGAGAMAPQSAPPVLASGPPSL